MSTSKKPELRVVVEQDLPPWLRRSGPAPDVVLLNDGPGELHRRFPLFHPPPPERLPTPQELALAEMRRRHRRPAGPPRRAREG